MKWKEESGTFVDPPMGTHMARCVGIIDIGTQHGEYKGVPNVRRQCIVRWELPTAKMDDGQPFIVSRFYTQSLSEKSNLRKDLANWRGRPFTKEELEGFDSKNILGKGCMLSITKNENTGKVGVSGVMALVSGMDLPPQITPSLYFSLDPEEFDQEVYDGLPDGIKGLIHASDEWKARAGMTEDRWAEDQEDPTPDDDVPF